MKEQSSCQAIPLIPSKNDWLLPQGIAAFVLQQFIPSWCQRHRQITLVSTNERQAGSIFAPIHHHWQACNPISFQLCFLSQDTNLSFWARPAGAVVIMVIFWLLFSFSPLLHSSSFYGVHDLWWAGWCFVQKFNKLILNCSMFLHRTTPIIIHRQLCQSGSYSSRPTHLLAWDPLRAGSLWIYFKDTWLSPTLWCFHGACSSASSGCCSESSTASVQAPTLHPRGSGHKERNPGRISNTRIPMVWLQWIIACLYVKKTPLKTF